MDGEVLTTPQGVTFQVVFMSQNKVHLDLFSFWQNVV